ncbi:MAG: calcium/sodium antiporter [Lachnospiraceae bacterium]|jgi:cation:H+ antiporter
MEYVLLLVGFFLLIKGADWFVDGSSSLAKFLRVPSAIIGLTIVAFGTSAPELSVSVTAGLSGQNEIAISNVLGSNLFNLLVVTGVCAIIAAVPVNRNIIRRELPLSIAAAVMLLIFCLTGNTVGRIEGILFLAVFAWFLFRQIKEALSSRHEAPSDPMEQVISPVKSIILIVIGCIGVVLGGTLVVDNATIIARNFGLSETFIGLTIIAIGTSLPELVTSVVASGKGENDLAIGNVVGSNIFNILMILGLSTTLHPITVQYTAIVDSIFLIAVSVLVLLFCRTRRYIDRWEGVIMVALYAAYSVYITLR